MRIAVAQIYQETNTFSPVKTTLKNFRDSYLGVGEAIARDLRGENIEINGMLQACAEVGFEAIPLIAAKSISGGCLTRDTLNFLLDTLSSQLDKALPVAGVCLAFRGARVSEEIDDREGAMLERVREIAGDGVPMAATFDCHANMTRKVV